jgi:sigma-B regulation protein RsbU (phosphoserine phosphatase)
VMGKGMPAAIIMATVRAAVRAAGRQPSFLASTQYAAQSIYADLAQAQAFVTMFAGYLDGRTGNLRYVDAGHGLALLRHADGTVEKPERRGLPLGVDAGERYEEGRVTLAPGDLALVYSDGLMEVLDDADPEEIARLAGPVSAPEAVERLTSDVGIWTDDVTVVALSRNPTA